MWKREQEDNDLVKRKSLEVLNLFIFKWRTKITFQNVSLEVLKIKQNAFKLETTRLFLYSFERNNIYDCNWIWTHNHLVHKQTLNHLAKLATMIELCCEYLFVRCIWMYVLILWRTRFRVSPPYKIQTL